ncbi:DUF2075 domain-containing protein [Alkalimonas delamerensis]|uniref:DNA 3'-5' helicase II n=1 Tax=Alkalimonas delamerensis TaxID=265981 RepID=A0ABT9GKD5_9GAMM|nr:DNA/RNA helicase domain-containing protein [Alkalimonas delamerensis]MDP4527434.1 DUF2075 domain-containing protein [Alkalimonas delamerensis]
MRMPTFAELDADQRGIYTESPSDGAVLVVGPPGTGKTVVAFHRALRLSSDGTPVVLIMFNKVLSQYANSVDVEHNIQILNLHKWVPKWYRQAFKSNPPKISPTMFDWPEIHNRIRRLSNIELLERLSWGHLIIDEGQDFPEPMYEALMALVEHPSLLPKSRPTLTVFADENQTITSENSTISQIRFALNATVKNKRYWHLFKNYRNTREISDFATYYQLTGRSATKVPDIKGVKPNSIFFPSHRQVAEHITNYVNNNGLVDVGVLSFGTKGDVKNIFNELRQLKDENKLPYRLQMYFSGDPRLSLHSDAKQLSFNTPPSITVLHIKSSKGLEFDAVFAVNLHSEKRNFDASSQELIKDMYVVSSRARRILFFDIVSFSESLPPSTRLLPAPSLELCRFGAQTEWKDRLKELLDEIPWSLTSEMSERLRIELLANHLLMMGNAGCELLSSVAERSQSHKAFAANLKQYFINLELQNIVRVITQIGYARVEKALSGIF